jgi:plasmid stabilization system protein ParE
MVMKIDWSDQAKDDIKEIFDYLKSAASEKIARKVVGKIYARLGILTTNPRGGQREWPLEDLPVEFRRLVSGNYKILYYVEETRVVITTVFDCRRNPATLREIVKRIIR